MGKKSRNRSAKTVRGDGSCSHAGSAIPAMKKSLAKAPDLTTCRTCKPNSTDNDVVDEKELFVCLRCCHVACRQHISDHYRSPRSDIHSHFLSTKSGIAHCIACDFKTLDEDENHIIRSAVNFLLQQLRRTNKSLGCVDQEQSEDWRAKAMRNVQSDIQNQILVNGDGKKNETKETSNMNGRSSNSPNGLINLGSTCYMNSSLQSLAACSSVRRCFDNFFLQAIPLHIASNSDEVEKFNTITFQYQDGALPERLAEVLRRVRPFEPEWKNAPPEPNKLVKSKLIGLKDEFTQRYPQFSNNWAEQDAHEFLRHFVDMVSENMKKRAVEVCKEDESEILKKISSVVECIFRSTLLYVKHCDKCDHYSTNLEHVLDLCVALDKDIPSSNAVRVTGAGGDLKRTNVPLSKHKLKKLRKEQKKKNRKHRNTNDRHVSESQVTQGSKGEDDQSENESDSESDGCVKKDELEDERSCVNGIHRKEDSDQGFPIFGQWDPSKDLSSSEDETNYDIFSLDVSNYSAVVREAGDAEEDNRNSVNDMEPDHFNKATDLESNDWNIGSKFTCLSSGYLTGMQPVYAASAKNENDLNDVLVNRLLMEDLENLESNEDDLVPLFNDFSTDVSVQPSSLEIQSNLGCDPHSPRSVSRCSMECELSSTRAEIDNSPTDLSSGEDLSDCLPESGELGCDKDIISSVTNDAVGASASDKEGSSSDDTIEQDKDLDPEVAKLAAQTLKTSSASSGLEQLLEKYFEETSLEDFKCPRCKKVGTTTSQQVIVELPPVLMITVKRFRGGLGQTQKIAASVDFPATLDLSTFTSRVALSLRCNSSRRYRLRAVIQHHGSARSGHYVAYVSVSRSPSDKSNQSNMTVRRGITVDELTSLCNSSMIIDDTEDVEGQTSSSEECEDENWFLVSDMAVDSASLSEALRAQAYILFYERC